MTLYISGPMTGYDDDNKPAFNQAAVFLRSLGHHVINPVESDEFAKTKSWTDFLRKDIVLIARECDCVALLPGWEHSRGARLEVFIAAKLGMFFRDALTGEFIQVDVLRDPVFGVNGITELLQWTK